MKKILIMTLIVTTISFAIKNKKIENKSFFREVFVSKQEKKEKRSIKLVKKWEINGLSMPESVLTIPNHKWVYVSNVNTDKSIGFISRINKNGKINKLKWIDGIKTPTGMGYYNGYLYVADQTQVHKIDVKTAKIVKTFESQAKTLNDITVTNTGEIFISDLSTGNIYKIKDDKAIKWIHSDLFPTPNGVLVDGDNLYVGSIGSILSMDLKPEQYGSLFKINLEDRSIKLIKSANKIGAIDGIVKFKGGFLISTPGNKNMFYITENIRQKIESPKGIADIWYNREENTLYAPLIFENKLIAYEIEIN